MAERDHFFAKAAKDAEPVKQTERTMFFAAALILQ
jgi:hypothetical protein